MDAELVELGVMGQWRHRLEDRREASSSMQRQSWWRCGGQVDEKSERTTNDGFGSVRHWPFEPSGLRVNRDTNCWGIFFLREFAFSPPGNIQVVIPVDRKSVV